MAATSPFPDVHALATPARRSSMPTLAKGGELIVLPGSAGPGAPHHRGGRSRPPCWCRRCCTLMDHPDSRTRDLSSLETVYYGASPINPVRLAEAVRTVRARSSAQYYGRSEALMGSATSPRATTPDRGDTRRLSSCGRPSAFLRRCRTRRRHARRASQVRSVSLDRLSPKGIGDFPEQTAGNLSGMVGCAPVMSPADADGFWYRRPTKDMIVTGSFSVFPREVERRCANAPSVAWVGVVSLRRQMGQTVSAVVVLPADDRDAITAEIQQSVKGPQGWCSPQTSDLRDASAPPQCKKTQKRPLPDRRPQRRLSVSSRSRRQSSPSKSQQSPQSQQSSWSRFLQLQQSQPLHQAGCHSSDSGSSGRRSRRSQCS